MSIESTIFTRLTGFTALAALVGTRVYPDVAPHTPDFPNITYSRVSSERHPAMGVDSQVVTPRFQFDIWAKTEASRTEVRNQLRAALKRWRNSGAGTVVQATYLQNEVDIYEPDTEIFHGADDYEINYEE